MIDGANNSVSSVAAGTSPFFVAVNPVSNRVYVANGNGASVTVIDGASDKTTTVVAELDPWSIAVNQEE